MAEVHKLSKFVKKVAPSMKFRRGRTGKGMRGGADYGDAADLEKEAQMRDGPKALAMLNSGASIAEVRRQYPHVR
jgi:hypothetical protein